MTPEQEIRLLRAAHNLVRALSASGSRLKRHTITPRMHSNNVQANNRRFIERARAIIKEQQQ